VLFSHAIAVVAFGAQSHTLAGSSARGEGMIQLWNLSNPAQSTMLGPLTTDGSETIALSRDGRTLASAGIHTIRLWDVSDVSHPIRRGVMPIDPCANCAVITLAFSPDGDTLASAGQVPIQLWNVTDRAHPKPVGRPFGPDSAGICWTLAFSPDGRTLASGNYDDTVRLWNVTDRAHPTAIGKPIPAQTGHVGNVDTVAFSPDGRFLASGGEDAVVRLWNVTDTGHPSLVGSLTGHTSGVNSVTFSPKGHTLASGGNDGTIRLWNITDPAHANAAGTITGADTPVALSPDGQTLAGPGGEFVQLWDLNVHDAIGRICDTTRNVLTRQRWDLYVSPHRRYDPPCPDNR
jgi:WD40 repeat protein